MRLRIQTIMMPMTRKRMIATGLHNANCMVRPPDESYSNGGAQTSHEDGGGGEGGGGVGNGGSGDGGGGEGRGARKKRVC